MTDDRFCATSTTSGKWCVMDFGDLERPQVVNERPFLYQYQAEYMAARLNKTPADELERGLPALVERMKVMAE